MEISRELLSFIVGKHKENLEVFEKKAEVLKVYADEYERAKNDVLAERVRINEIENLLVNMDREVPVAEPTADSVVESPAPPIAEA